MSSTATPAKTIWWLTKRFLPYLRAVRWQAIVAAGLMFSSPLVAVLLLWLMKVLIDDVFVDRNIYVFPTIAGAYLILVVAKLLIDYLLTRVEAAIAERINQNVRVDIYRHLISSSPGSLRKYSVGDLLAHLSSDIERVETLIYSAPVRAIYNIVTGLFFICFLLFLSWQLTLCALITAPILALLSWRLSPRARRVARISRRKATALFSRAEERLGAPAVIQAFDAHAAESQAFEAVCSAARVAELRSVAVQAWLTLVVELVAAIGGLVVLAASAYEMYVGNLTIGTLIAFLGSVGSLYGPISSLASTSGRLQRAAAGAQRVVDLLDTPSLVAERPGAKPLTAVRGRLEFSGVCFSYPGGSEALRGVSFHIEPGETVAVVGSNGSGKSTLVQLALRLYDPSEGVVSIDGTDLRDTTLKSLREAVAVVFQEPGVFRGTIGENIRYGKPEASDELFTSAAEKARVHAFANASLGGYSRPIGPRGAWLSGGQRQRVALARALLRDSPILLLDEATASIDSEAEHLIQEAVERYHGKRTILVVSHQLSTVFHADRVIVMDEGEILESGSPAALLRNQTRFRELFAAQILGEKIHA